MPDPIEDLRALIATAKTRHPEEALDAGEAEVGLLPAS